jgi:hypothetical protein
VKREVYFSARVPCSRARRSAYPSSRSRGALARSWPRKQADRSSARACPSHQYALTSSLFPAGVLATIKLAHYRPLGRNEAETLGRYTIRTHSTFPRCLAKMCEMTRERRTELLTAAVAKLEEAAHLLITAEEELFADSGPSGRGCHACLRDRITFRYGNADRFLDGPCASRLNGKIIVPLDARPVAFSLIEARGR